MVCTDKVPYDGSHGCGTSPGAGTITIRNVGIHLVAIFAVPPGIDISNWHGVVGEISALGVHPIYDIPVNGTATFSVTPGDRVYIGRSDGTFSWRTISVRFEDVPGLLGGPPGGGVEPSEQSMLAVLDSLSCPANGQTGSLQALGTTIAVTESTGFDAETCADLASLMASGVRFHADVSVLEDRDGALTAAAVSIAEFSKRPGNDQKKPR
jgi:hypothetical protein